MKNFLLSLALLCSFSAFSQTCPFVSCADSLGSTATKDTLAITPGFVVQKMTIINGPATAVISGLSVTGLTPGTTCVVNLVASTANTTVVATKVITVAPAPPTIPTVTAVALVAGQLQITLSTGVVLKL